MRVAQLAEAIEVMRAMWTESPATYHGTYYHVDGAYCEPRPDPPIPIMVGTNGPKALGVTARLADWWNWDGPWEEVYREPYETLRAHCEAIGRPFEEIALTAGFTISMPDDPSTFEATYEHDFYPGRSSATSARRRQTRSGRSSGWSTSASATSRSFEDMTTYRRFIDEVVPVVRLERRG